MFIYRNILFLSIACLFLAQISVGHILGHSGLVLHVDKHGRISGHSSHYDYRVYPEENLLNYVSLYNQHNVIGHHEMIDDEHQEAFDLIDNAEFHNKPEYHGNAEFHGKPEYHDNAEFHGKPEYHDNAEFHGKPQYHDNAEFHGKPQYHDNDPFYYYIHRNDHHHHRSHHHK